MDYRPSEGIKQMSTETFKESKNDFWKLACVHGPAITAVCKIYGIDSLVNKVGVLLFVLGIAVAFVGKKLGLHSFRCLINALICQEKGNEDSKITNLEMSDGYAFRMNNSYFISLALFVIGCAVIIFGN